MQFGAEIVRGLRLALIVFAVALVGILAYRIVTVDDSPEASTPRAKPVEHGVRGKEIVKGEKSSAIVPMPPPVGGRVAVAAKPAPQPQAKETTIVTLPATEQALAGGLSPIDDPHTVPLITAAEAPPVEEADVVAPVEKKPESRATKVFRSVRHFLRLGK
jgi:hypothetical protein